jgi:hypothetical protein
MLRILLILVNSMHPILRFEEEEKSMNLGLISFIRNLKLQNSRPDPFSLVWWQPESEGTPTGSVRGGYM